MALPCGFMSSTTGVRCNILYDGAAIMIDSRAAFFIVSYA